MSVYYSYLTGNPADVTTPLIKRVSAFTRNSKVTNFKIGITNDPDRRWRELHKFSYDEMLVLYGSSSINNVSLLETWVIEHNRDHCDNIKAGGAGGIAELPPYYLYVVVKYHSPAFLSPF